MTPLFPFTNPKCHFMQRAVVSFIESPKFFFRLPALTNRSWTLVNNPSAERERLEFLGDALIGSCISEELFRCRPHEGPGFYTNARSVLTANSTFAHLMRKVGLYRPGDPVKPAGDTFETTLAAYYSEMGPEALKVYVRTYFVPLIFSVSKAHDRYLKTRIRTRKHLCFTLDSERRRLDRVRSGLKTKIKKQSTKHNKASYPSRSFRVRSAKQSPKTSSIVIDLTSDDEGISSYRVTQGPVTMPKASTSSTTSTSKVFSVNKPTDVFVAPQMQKHAGSAVGPTLKIPGGLLSRPNTQLTSSTHTAWSLPTRAPRLALVQSSFVDIPQTIQSDISLDLRPSSGRPSVLGSIDNPILID